MSPSTDVSPAPATTATDVADAIGTDDELVEEELLVEEISIDGMCGVY
ncbi:MAG: mycofactocin precursor MftA [Acidimicrobiales bacterium]